MTDEKRDLVCVGASAGGVDAISTLLAQLPRDFPAAVLIVMHTAPTQRGLADVFAKSSALPVAWAVDESPVRPATVRVAPPDRHTVLADGTVRVVSGPRVNLHRPAIDPLFRSAAVNYSGRAIGVLLTGYRDDGVAGLAAIKEAGGAVVVQEPAEAEAPDLPENAIRSVRVDRILPLSGMGAALLDLVTSRAPPAVPPDPALAAEVRLEGGETVHESLDDMGERAVLSCPECGGGLWEIGVGGALRHFRCRVGHSLSPELMLDQQGENVERDLWAAVRALQERASFAGRLARDIRFSGAEGVAAGYEEEARRSADQADRARRFILEMQAERARRPYR